MKWIALLGFFFISFTVLAAEGDEKAKVKKRKTNFRNLASVSQNVAKDVELRYRDNMLREEEQRIFNQKEDWLKTLEYMEKNSFE